jgi:sugar/nucleoside kinase (ribokinase family)
MHIGYPPILPGTLEDDGAPLRDLLKRAKSLGITTSMDMAGVDPKSEGGKVNWNRFFELTMPYLDVFSPSVEDIFTARKIGRHATREEVISTAEELVGYGCAVVLLSDGENGLYLKTAGKDRLGTSGRAFEKNSSEWSDCAKWYDAINPEVFVSTLAAGDACSAGLLYAIAREMGPEQGAHFALAFPAVTIAGKITTEAEVLKIK